MLESTLVREKEFSFFPLPTIFSLLAKLREIYIAHKLAAVSWLKSYMQHSFQHQSIIIRREHMALHVFVLCLRWKAPGKKHQGKIQLQNKQLCNGKRTILHKDGPLWFEMGKKIGRLKARRAEGFTAEFTVVLVLLRWWERPIEAKCWNQPVTPRKTAHVRWNT